MSGRALPKIMDIEYCRKEVDISSFRLIVVCCGAVGGSWIDSGDCWGSLSSIVGGWRFSFVSLLTYLFGFWTLVGDAELSKPCWLEKVVVGNV